jgi:hypothetical protein
MQNKYRRSVDIYLGILIIGIIIIIDVFRVPTFIWLYDGIKLLLSIVAIIIGGWAVFTPYAVITEDTLKLFNSVLQTKKIEISKIDDVKLINVQNKIDVKVGNKTHEIKLKSVRKKDREALRTDLKEKVNRSA